jgi:hypothetical protein
MDYQEVKQELYENSLLIASEKGDLDTLKCLIDLGAKNYNEAFRKSAISGKDNIVEYLLNNYSVDVYAMNDYALLYSNHIEVLLLLMKYYTDVQLREFNIKIINNILDMNDDNRSEHSIDSYSSLGIGSSF